MRYAQRLNELLDDIHFTANHWTIRCLEGRDARVLVSADNVDSIATILQILNLLA